MDRPLIATAASALNSGSTIAVDLRGEVHHVTVYVTTSAGVSAGVVSIEEAPSTDYTGTWSVVGTVTTSTASSTSAVHLTGTYKALRTRISTAITGGTVTTHIVAAEGA